jgi:2Fe-2S ferredoxin
MLLATRSALDADGALLDACRARGIEALMPSLRASPRARGCGRHRSGHPKALAAGTEAFAAMRMNRGIQQALAGKNIEIRLNAPALPPCPSSRSFPIPSTARRAPRSRRRRGTSICEALLDNSINIEHACDMSCACTTCHVIVREGFASLNERGREEEDLLDRAWGLEPQSRLSLPGHRGAEGPGGGDRYSINHAKENHKYSINHAKRKPRI